MVNQEIKDEFFIIESDNLEKVQSEFYGYTIINDNIHISKKIEEDAELSGNGSYISINNDSKMISISQDSLGSYALYLFEHDDYFAISNSFKKLEEYLKDKFILTFNYNYAKTLISSESSSFSFDETLINEIQLIPSNNKVLINIEDKTISYEDISPDDASIEFGTKESLSCLDNWFNKWVSIYRNIIKDNYLYLDFNNDLSSMVLITLALNANVNPENIYINNEELSSANEEILSDIAKDYNLNIRTVTGKKIDDINVSLEKSFFTKLASQKQVGFNTISYDENIFSLNTDDVIIKKSYLENIDKFLEEYIIRSKVYSETFSETVEKSIWDTLHKFQKHLKIYDIYSKDFFKKFNDETILRNKLGKSNVEDYLFNKINLNPFMDNDLQKIDTEKLDDDNLVYLFIIQRYCPDLLKYNYDEYSIDDKAFNYIKEINDKQPFTKNSYESIEGFNLDESKYNDVNDDDEIYKLLSKIFRSNSFKHNLLKYLSNDVYSLIYEYNFTNKKEYYNDIYAAISIVKIINDIEHSQEISYNTDIDWLKSFLTIDNNDDELILFIDLLRKYFTARIDIKNEGTVTNRIKLYDISDSHHQITTPSWFNDEKGEGSCLTSRKGKISFKIKCINDGNLRFELRTMDVKDRLGHRFPVYVDYLNCKIDGEEYLKQNTLAWHDEPIIINKNVYNCETVEVYIKWQPVSNLSKYN